MSATRVSRFLSMLLVRFSVLTSSVMPTYWAPSSVASCFAVVVFPTPGVPVIRISCVIFFVPSCVLVCFCFVCFTRFVVRQFWASNWAEDG